MNKLCLHCLFLVCHNKFVWKKLLTSPVVFVKQVSFRLLQVVSSLFKNMLTTGKQDIRTQLVDGLVADLLQILRFLGV